MTRYAKIVATGSYLPERILTNDELAQQVETSDEWIKTRTGIQSRHIAHPTETTAKLGLYAAQKALKKSGYTADMLDMIVVATCTPDHYFPSTACVVQEGLGISGCPAFDIQAACSGFMYALSVVENFIKTGAANRVLLIGTEIMSRALDWSDRTTCILFGDGAGAMILEADSAPGILKIQLGADGRQKHILSWERDSNATLVMHGNTVFKLAVITLGSIAEQLLQESGLTTEALDWLVPHQANIRIIQATAERLGLSMQRVVVTLPMQGNTSAASIPLALDAAIEDGRIQRGQLLLLEAFGAGLTWGAALVRY